jgi:hypothetical protein
VEIISPDVDFVISPGSGQEAGPEVNGCRQDITLIIIRMFADEVDPARSRGQDLSRGLKDSEEGVCF